MSATQWLCQEAGPTVWVGARLTGLEDVPLWGAAAQLWEELAPWKQESNFPSLHSISPSCVTFKMLPDFSGSQSFICYTMLI